MKTPAIKSRLTLIAKDGARQLCASVVQEETSMRGGEAGKAGR